MCLFVYELCVFPEKNVNNLKLIKVKKKNQISGLSDYRLLRCKELTPLPLWSLSKQVSKASQLICNTHGSVEELPTNKKPES